MTKQTTAREQNLIRKALSGEPWWPKKMLVVVGEWNAHWFTILTGSEKYHNFLNSSGLCLSKVNIDADDGDVSYILSECLDETDTAHNIRLLTDDGWASEGDITTVEGHTTGGNKTITVIVKWSQWHRPTHPKWGI